MNFLDFQKPAGMVADDSHGETTFYRSMNSPKPDPAKRSPNLYQMSAQPERKGGGGTVVIVLLLLLLAGGGAYYYFKMYKQPVAAALPMAATPTPMAAKAVATPTPGYNSVTEQSYIDTADKAFLAVQQPKKQAFDDARKAYSEAGGASPKGLTSKEAVAARRDLVAKFIAANDDYAAFAATQDAFYKAELSKTPLTPKDVDETFSGYVEKAKTADFIKIREAQHNTLKSADDMLAALAKWSGSWTVSPAGKLAFKRPADASEYNSLASKYNGDVQELNRLQNAFTGTAEPDGAAAASAAAPATPNATPAPTATVSP